MKKLLNVLKIASLGLFSGLIGAWAGVDGTSKAWRRFVLPLLYLGLIWSNMSSLWCLTVLGMIGAFSLGYGIPDINDLDGSPLGRFWWEFFSLYPMKKHLLADIFTRGTISKLVCLSLIGIPIVKGNWVMYLCGSVVITVVYSVFSWRDLGTFEFRGKRLLVSEMVVYTIIGIVVKLLVR